MIAMISGNAPMSETDVILQAEKVTKVRRKILFCNRVWDRNH